MADLDPVFSESAREFFWPPILFAEDLARAFRISLPVARRRLLRGEFGPRFRSGRQWAVRKESLLKHLAAIESAPAPEGFTAGHPRLLRIDSDRIGDRIHRKGPSK